MVTIPKSDYDGLVRYTLAPFYATVIFTEYSLLLLGNTVCQLPGPRSQIPSFIRTGQLKADSSLANLRRNLYKGGVSNDVLDASFSFTLYLSETDFGAI